MEIVCLDAALFGGEVYKLGNVHILLDSQADISGIDWSTTYMRLCKCKDSNYLKYSSFPRHCL